MMTDKTNDSRYDDIRQRAATLVDELHNNWGKAPGRKVQIVGRALLHERLLALKEAMSTPPKEEPDGR